MDQAVHLHRAPDWYESELEQISKTEWRACVARHDDLMEAEGGPVRWTGHPAGAVVTLRWEDGRISVDDADPETCARLAMLATELGVTLQGDDLTVYGPDGQPVAEEDDDWPNVDVDELPDDVDMSLWETASEPAPWDPNRPTSRGDFIKGLFRRE